MLSGRLLLLFVTNACVGIDIFEDVGQANLEAVRIRLEEEKAKRLLLQNDVEVLMIQAEELKRKCGQKENTGYMAGSEHRQTGNGPNNLCLPEDPTWARYQDGTFDGDHRARVYGTEYQIGGAYTPFSPDLLDNDVPCVVCRTIRSSSIMIPGRTNCYSGWTVEYSGYLVSLYYGHASPTEYVCLDGDPESIDGGKTNQNGHMIYLVDVICGPLRCPPYVNGRELACVICSK